MTNAKRPVEQRVPQPRHETHKALLDAVDHLCRIGGAPTIAAVAREVGVTPGLIHNRYPEVASTIRNLSGKQKRDEITVLKAALQEERGKCSKLRAENYELFAEVRALASGNEALRRARAIEQARNAGKLVTLQPRAPKE
jgi:hypothetical protein